MGGIIDFSTSCPWQLYTFSFIHLIAAIFLYLFDVCHLVFPTKTHSCVGSEIVAGRMAALCLLYVGVIFTVLTYHNKSSPAKITRLSNVALNGAAALLVAVIFAGNHSHAYGLERGWMHVGDMLTMLLLAGILAARVTSDDAVWANKQPLKEGHGLNCKSLLSFFVVVTLIKVLLLSDFVDPTFVMADGLEMTKVSHYLWNLTIVLVVEIFLGLNFSLLFDDDASHELMVGTIAVMTGVAIGSIFPIREYMSAMYAGGTGLWIKLGVMLGLCAAALIGGRVQRRGYQAVGGEGMSLNV